MSGDATGAADRRLDRALPALGRKYRTLAALRAAREAREAAGLGRFEAAAGVARREAFRRIARRFPGALRQLDVLDAAALSARAGEVEAACAGTPAAGWIALDVAVHRALRRAFREKRWLLRGGVGPPVDAADVAAFARRFRLDPGVASARIAFLLRPPAGRLAAAVLAEEAARRGLAIAEAERMLFGDG